MDPVNSTSVSNFSADNGKTFAILAYFIFFLPILAAKDSKLAMFHANQSLILLLVWVATWVLSMIIPPIGLIASIGVFVLWIIGILSAIQGQMKPLPLIGKYTLIK